MRKFKILTVVFLLIFSTFSLLTAKDQKFLIESSSNYLESSTIIFDDSGKFGLLTYCELDYAKNTCVMKAQKLKYLMNKKKLKLVKKPYTVNSSELYDMGITYFNQPYTWYNPSRGSGYVVWTDYPYVSPSSVYIAQLDIKKGKIIGKPYRVPGPDGATKFAEGSKIDCYMPLGCAFGLFNIVVYSTKIYDAQDEKYQGLYMAFTNPLTLYLGPQRIVEGSVYDTKKMGEKSELKTFFLTCKATAISCAACQDSIVIAFTRQKYDPDRQSTITLACAAKTDVGKDSGDKNSRSDCGCSGDIEILPCENWEVEVAELSQDFSRPTSVAPVGPLKNQPEGNNNDEGKTVTMTWRLDNSTLGHLIDCADMTHIYPMTGEEMSKHIEEAWALSNEIANNNQMEKDNKAVIPNYWVGYTKKNNGRFLAQGMDASKKEIKFIGRIRKSQKVGENNFGIDVKYHGGCAFISYIEKEIGASKSKLNLYKFDLK